ncbi:MAG: trypsin-like peptidase domain-containing protein, partial [Nitrospinae bacterium]|nr:trypsin-like peptidase domain-containing protein [Nitrospinota bacterium]
MDAKVAAGTREVKRYTQLWRAALGLVSLICAAQVWANPDMTAPPEEAALVQLFEGVSPAVVSVVASRGSRQATNPGQESRGSGFFIDREGYLLTTAHFLHKADQIAVITGNGQEVPARVAGLDLALNVALLK